MITDIHVHHVPEPFARFVEKAAPYLMHRDPASGETVALNVGPLKYGLNRTFFDLERLIKRMQEMSVDHAVLSLATPFVKFDVPTSLGIEAAQLYNDEIARIHRAAPDTFDGWAFLPMQDPEAAANELCRAVRNLGLIGGYLPSNVKGRYLDSKEFAPIFDAATQLDVPLIIHPSNPPARDRTGDYELAVVSGYLFDTTLNIFHMIFSGLLDRYPGLRLCCTHLGGFAALLRARMQRELDTNPGLAARLKRPLTAYLQSIYYDTICFEPAYLRAALESDAVDPAHLVLGSDTPFPLGEPDPVGFIERSFRGHCAETADAILHRNASNLFARRASGVTR
jgi:aminocarboxymuconate-semialdehyde decarboxylase